MGQYELRRRGGKKEQAPCSSNELRRMATEGNLHREDSIRRVGKTTWHPIHSVPGLVKLIPLRANLAKGQQPPSGVIPKDDSSSDWVRDDIELPSSAGIDLDDEDLGEPLPMELPPDQAAAPTGRETVSLSPGQVDTTDFTVEAPGLESVDLAPEAPPTASTRETVNISPDEVDLEEFSVDAPGLDPVEATEESQEEADEEDMSWLDEIESSGDDSESPVPSSTPDDQEDLASDFMSDDENASSSFSTSSASAPTKPLADSGKESHTMNTSLSGRTQTALYLILAGLLARPLMKALDSLMENESISGFLREIGELGAIGGAGLGVIMLLSDTLTPRENESGSDAAVSTLLRVAMVFVIVIMLVVLMELVGNVKLEAN